MVDLEVSMIDLYTWGTPNGQKIPILLEETGLPYTVHPIDLAKGEQHDPAFLAINPNGKIPAIVDRLPEGDITVFESGAILIYLAEKAGRFIPAAPAARMECLSWLFWQIGGLGPMVGQWNFFKRQKKPNQEPNPAAQQRYFDESLRLFGVLDQQLSKRDYLAGDYSIADIANFTWARAGMRGLAEEVPDMAERFAGVQRWLTRIELRPAVQAGLQVPAA
jgi:GST-like protein